MRGVVKPAALALLSVLINRMADANAQTLAIQPMTQANVQAHSGYMSDPYPIRLARFIPEKVQLLSGTTPNLISCAYPIAAGCFTSKSNTVEVTAIRSQITNSGMQYHGAQNRDIFQDDRGRWHMAVAIDYGPNEQENRTVIAHASPAVDAAPGSVPTRWSVDRVLVGSFDKLDQGNYDCKYFEDRGRLYLLYVKNLQANPLVNGIVIQPMISPTRLAPVDPTLLLSPSEADGGFSSEQFANTTSKLVEAPNISVINGKYAMAYSTGSYLTAGYKAGVAWSDTLLPSSGGQYRKVLDADDQDLWRNPSRVDVHYLVQSQVSAWPNDTLDEVVGPGVASIVRDPAGQWTMFFNAYNPGDMPTTSSLVEAAHRRPYFLKLQVNVPTDVTVAEATDTELASWLAPFTR